MIADNYYFGDLKIEKVYLGVSLIFILRVLLEEYLLAGRNNAAVAYAVDSLAA